MVAEEPVFTREPGRGLKCVLSASVRLRKIVPPSGAASVDLDCIHRSADKKHLIFIRGSSSLPDLMYSRTVEMQRLMQKPCPTFLPQLTAIAVDSSGRCDAWLASAIRFGPLFAKASLLSRRPFNSWSKQKPSWRFHWPAISSPPKLWLLQPQPFLFGALLPILKPSFPSSSRSFPSLSAISGILITNDARV